MTEARGVVVSDIVVHGEAEKVILSDGIARFEKDEDCVGVRTVELDARYVGMVGSMEGVEKGVMLYDPDGVPE